MSDHLRDQAAAFLKSRAKQTGGETGETPATTPAKVRPVAPISEVPQTSAAEIVDGAPSQGLTPSSGSEKSKKTKQQRKKTTEMPTARGRTKVPPPVYRTGDATERIALEAPMEFESLRETAYNAGMNVSQLVLAVIAAEREQLIADATKAPILIERWPPGRKRWTLLLSEEEIDELDLLVDELARAFNRRSRTAVLLEVLRRWTN